MEGVSYSVNKTEGKMRQLIFYLSHSSIIMWRCLFLIPLQPSSPSIMPPSSRVHPPACLIWTFRRVSFACTHPSPLSIDLRTPRWNQEGTSGGHVIPKADSKFWTGDHSIRKSYIKGIQCLFRFWTYNILPPILSTLHISFMCSQSISTLIKLTGKSINIQQCPINIVRFVRTPRFVFKQRWFPICFQTRERACSRTCSSY